VAEEKNKTEKSTLYLVGTPIGNLADISDRAKKVLSEVDFIAAEDTRNTLRLLLALGIKQELVSYHEHNKASAGPRIIDRIRLGESCALVTDAGMPAISDPGEDLVRLASSEGVRVSVIPGPCAAISALALSALPTRKFTFEGFLSANAKERAQSLSELVEEKRTMVFYEAPHKLKATLSDMKTAFGEKRKISLCRELTKLKEQALRTTLGEAVSYYEQNEPRGEYVLVVEGASKSEIAAKNPLLDLSPEEHVLHYVSEGLSKMDATKAAAKDRGMSKSELYKLINS
jgi:16S rRNA (cytidine1402-2'-O)-methyltransferase